MKYLYWGAAILLSCLALCAVSAAVLSRAAGETAALLDSALAAAEQDDFSVALGRTEQAMAHWTRHKGFFGTVLRHAETDQIQADFHALRQSARDKNAEEFPAACAALAAQIRHLAQLELPYYYNILAAGVPGK